MSFHLHHFLSPLSTVTCLGHAHFYLPYPSTAPAPLTWHLHHFLPSYSLLSCQYHSLLLRIHRTTVPYDHMPVGHTRLLLYTSSSSYPPYLLSAYLWNRSQPSCPNHLHRLTHLFRCSYSPAVCISRILRPHQLSLPPTSYNQVFQ